MSAITLHTIEEVANILRVDKHTVYRLAQQNKLKGSKVGSNWRFTEGDIHDYLKSTRGDMAQAA